MSRRWGKGFDTNQLHLDWQARTLQHQNQPLPAGRPGQPVLQLRWDFRTRFPQPTDEALNHGMFQPEDTEPENLAALHSAHANRMLATLSDIEAAADAARLGVDPTTGKTPIGQDGRQRLEAARRTEPGRLQRWYENLLGAYRDLFGDEAADAFDKAVRAWHARIEVIVDKGLAKTHLSAPAHRPDCGQVVVEPMPSAFSDSQVLPPATAEDSTMPLLPAPRESRFSDRVIARLPVPRPLPEAVAAGDFGSGENGRAINPSPAEVREITVTHAEQLIELIGEAKGAAFDQRQQLKEKYLSGIAAYASSFGPRAAAQLDAYVRREAGKAKITPMWRSQQSEVER
jgi:hypothetical protein